MVSLIEQRNEQGIPCKYYAIEWNTPQRYEEEDVQAVVNQGKNSSGGFAN